MAVSVSRHWIPHFRGTNLTFSLVIVDITDFLAEEIKGPGKFSSRTGEDSRFEEPAMNQLISDIFGDTQITLRCKSGECLRASEVPGFVVRSSLPDAFCAAKELASRSVRPNPTTASGS